MISDNYIRIGLRPASKLAYFNKYNPLIIEGGYYESPQFSHLFTLINSIRRFFRIDIYEWRTLPALSQDGQIG